VCVCGVRQTGQTDPSQCGQFSFLHWMCVCVCGPLFKYTLHTTHSFTIPHPFFASLLSPLFTHYSLPASHTTFSHTAASCCTFLPLSLFLTPLTCTSLYPAWFLTALTFIGFWFLPPHWFTSHSLLLFTFHFSPPPSSFLGIHWTTLHFCLPLPTTTTHQQCVAMDNGSQ